MSKIVLLFAVVLSLFSQPIDAQTLSNEIARESSKPLSIYAFSNSLVNKEKQSNSFFDYQLPKFEFLQVNFRNMDVRDFTLNPANNLRVPSQFMAQSFINVPKSPIRLNEKEDEQNTGQY